MALQVVNNRSFRGVASQRLRIKFEHDELASLVQPLFYCIVDSWEHPKDAAGLALELIRESLHWHLKKKAEELKFKYRFVARKRPVSITLSMAELVLLHTELYDDYGIAELRLAYGKVDQAVKKYNQYVKLIQ